MKRFCLLLIFCCAGTLCANDDISNPDLTKATWVWTFPEAISGGGGEAYFRFKFRPETPIKEATLLITADNGYDLRINNKFIAEELGASADQWGTVERYRIEKNLVPRAANCIAIKAECLGASSGLLVAIKIVFENGDILEKYSDDTWLATEEPKENWWEPDHDDSAWGKSVNLAPFGQGPWGDRLIIAETVTDPETLKVERTGGGMRRTDSFTEPAADFQWPDGIVFLQGRAPDNSTPLATTNFRIGETRAYWENDVPAPSISGFKMFTLVPASPDGVMTEILDAGTGLIGSPCCSYDGKTILFCMAPEGKTFFHIYQINRDGTGLQQLTDGPWHDTDPCLLPDGSVVFSSTRTGARDEYHANTAHSLFRWNPDEDTIRPVTYHITADADPEVMQDGRIAFVRHDNFLERAKVETHIHCVRPDGTTGEILIGPDRGAISYDLSRAAEGSHPWLRNFGFGSPAPLTDGRIAAMSHAGPVITVKPKETENGVTPTQDEEDLAAIDPNKPIPHNVAPMPCRVSVNDLAATPDNRILVSTQKKAIALVDPETGEAVRILQSPLPIHSVCFLGTRPMPRFWPDMVDETLVPTDTRAVGYFYCADVYNTKQKNAEWDRVRAIRIYEGNPMRLRSARHQYGHVGTVGVELGTIPLMTDGSFIVEVPADVPLAIQAVDAEGQAVVSELSWIYTRPDEFRSCTGCHADRAATPGFTAPASVQKQPPSLSFGTAPPRFRANNGANGGVLNLQLERMRETISVDLYPESVLVPGSDLSLGRNGETARLHEILATSKSEGDRFSAVQRLGILRPQDKATGDLLAGVMRNDANQNVRMEAALVLAVCAKSEHVPALLEAFDDPFDQVALAAHSTLEHISGNTEMDPRTLKEKDAKARKELWTKWFDANSPATIEQTQIAVLKTPCDWTVTADSLRVRRALESLAHYGTDAAKKEIRTLLESQGEKMDLVAKLTAVRTLGYLNDEAAVPLLKTMLDESCKQVMPQAPASHEFGWTAMPDHLGGAAAEALGRIGGRDAENALIGAFDSMGDFWFYSFRVADHDWLMGSVTSILHSRILESLDTLGSVRGKEIADKIVKSVPIDSDRGILLENDVYETVAGRVLWRSGVAQRYIDEALDVLECKPATDPALREAVTASPPAVSTGPLEPTSRAAQTIMVLAWDTKDEPRKKRIREAFEKFRIQEASRERSWVCFMLARAIGRLDDQEATPYLVAALTDEKKEFDFGSAPPPNIFLNEAMTPVHRAAAASALGRLGDSKSVPILLGVVKDFDNMMDVRDAAAEAIGVIAVKMKVRGEKPDPAIVRELRETAETYPELYTGKTLFDSVQKMEK